MAQRTGFTAGSELRKELNEAAERYEKLRVEAGLPALNETAAGQKANNLQVV